MTVRHRLPTFRTRPIQSSLAFLSKLVLGSYDRPNKQETARSPPEQLRTERGEVVRNQSEMMIANYLHRNNVSYTYDVGSEGREILPMITNRPEFYLNDYDVYVEYWDATSPGDGKSREQYQRMRRWKMVQYQRSNIKFISIYPSNLTNLDWIFRNKFRRITGVDLPRNQAAS